MYLLNWGAQKAQKNQYWDYADKSVHNWSGAEGKPWSDRQFADPCCLMGNKWYYPFFPTMATVRKTHSHANPLV